MRVVSAHQLGFPPVLRLSGPTGLALLFPLACGSSRVNTWHLAGGSIGKPWCWGRISVPTRSYQNLNVSLHTISLYQHSLSYTGHKLWNNIQQHIKTYLLYTSPSTRDLSTPYPCINTPYRTLDLNCGTQYPNTLKHSQY